MANFGIRIDLLKLKGAFMRNLKGQTATKRCLIIPVDECEGMFLGEKGCYLSLTAIEMQNPQYNETHCVKADVPREQRETMTEEERRSLPILGGMREIKPKAPQSMQVQGTLGQNDIDDLPF
jgi:hypothetical protein